VPSTPLPRSTPREQGVDAGALDALLDALETAPDVEPHGLVLVRHGSVVAEGWWAPYAPDRRCLLYSLSKSFTSTAVGVALGEGLLALDDTVLGHFPELDVEVTDPRSRRMRIRDVAAMASGHRDETLQTALARDRENLLRGFLLTPPDAEPGTLFAYNQPCTYALSATVCRAAGTSLLEYLRPRVFDPIGIGDVVSQRDADGLEFGFSGMYATTEDIARLGLLYLRDGVHEGRRLLPEGWVAEATRRHVDTPGPTADWAQGYGFQFWRSQHGYRGDGAYGQFCLVLPEHDAVLALTTEARDMQAALDAVWAHLLPALAGPPSGPDADARLAARLAALELPRVEATEPVPADLAGVRFEAVDGGAVAALEVDGGQARLEVPVGRHGMAFPVPLGGPGWTTAAPMGPDGVPIPVATSSGRDGTGTVHLDVVLLETPHRLQIRARPADRGLTAAWRTEPLNPGPHWLRAPGAAG
jgi:CubicO group peptidase (beta-lactamase class C family)